MMLSRSVVVVILTAVGGALVGLQQLHATAHVRPERYRLAAVDRGDVVSGVRASGTLSPERQLTLLAGVPGTITAISVGDNDLVQDGQVLVELDATQAKSHLDLARTDLKVAQRAVDIAAGQRDRARIQVDNAEAALVAAKADLAHAQEVSGDAERDMDRMAALAKTGDAARVDTQKARTARDESIAATAAAQAHVRESEANAAMARGDVVVAEAQLQNVVAAVATHEAAVRDAELQVDQMSIRSPMAGVVLDHSALVGQAVGPAAPLFTVASDLGRIILHANVDESDIGRIEIGQEAAFTVDSFPGQSFRGVVWLIKHTPQVSQSVVTYDVELTVDNPAQQLLPGMTATASITTGTDSGAVRVPTSALRFRPEGTADAGDAVWTVGEDGEPVRHAIQRGRSDAVYTAVATHDLDPGDKVIVGLAAKRTDNGRRQSILGF
jgi:HlyD family secretion protein